MFERLNAEPTATPPLRGLWLTPVPMRTARPINFALPQQEPDNFLDSVDVSQQIRVRRERRGRALLEKVTLVGPYAKQ